MWQEYLRNAVCSEAQKARLRSGEVRLPKLALTADNVTKMISILMKVEAGLNVLLIGESGCGKVRREGKLLLPTHLARPAC